MLRLQEKLRFVVVLWLCMQMTLHQGLAGRSGSSSSSRSISDPYNCYSSKRSSSKGSRRGMMSSRRSRRRMRIRKRNRNDDSGSSRSRRNRNLRRRGKGNRGTARRNRRSRGKGKGKGIFVDGSRSYYYDPGCNLPQTRFPTIAVATIEPTSAPSTQLPTALPSTTPTMAPEINFRNGFPCDDNPFTINQQGNGAFPQLVQNDATATDPSLCFLRMTDDLDGGLAATAFLPLTFDATNTNRQFSMTIGYRVFGSIATVGDGMAFILHQDPRGVAAISTGGGALGVYADPNDPAAGVGLQRALVIEWDTVQNTEYLDDSQRSIHVMQVS